MADPVDVMLERLEKGITKEYAQAVRELNAKYMDYMRRFAIKQQKWLQMVANGEKTMAEYQAWARQQIMVGKRWADMRDTVAYDLHRANCMSRDMIRRYLANVYAESFQYATWQVEAAAGIDTSFTLINSEAVARIMREEPQLLPLPGPQMQNTFALFDAYKASGDATALTGKLKKAFDVYLANNRDIRWQKGQIESVTLQGILQGESIPNISKRIAMTLGEINHKATIRYARTATTAAQNAGHDDAYHRAEALGVKMVREWLAVHDGRTRHEHRVLDGQRRPNGVPFEAEGEEIMRPGDPAASPHMIWNCRCATRAIVEGLEPRARKYRNPMIEGMTYDEWKASREERSDPITKQEDIAEAMKWRTINELYRGKRNGASN